MKIQSCIDNYINGNLTDAKEQAKRFSWEAIYKGLRDSFGWTEAKSKAVADYLKHPSRDTFDRACNQPPCYEMSMERID